MPRALPPSRQKPVDLRKAITQALAQERIVPRFVGLYVDGKWPARAASKPGLYRDLLAPTASSEKR